MRRGLLLSLKIVAAGIAVMAYQDPDSFYFTHRMALYCVIVTGLITYYSWSDLASRILCVSLTSLAVNNLYDELFGDPLTFGWNEFFFGILILIILIYQSYRLWKQRGTK